MVNEAVPSGTTNAPPSDTPVPVLYRYTDGTQSWKTWLGGPDVPTTAGLSMSPDMNGDLVYSVEAGLYGAYFVVTDYTTDYAGHFGDSIQYVNEQGALQQITGATSSWGCSHNTGIAFEAAEAAPFASICAEDQGAIWLNTKTQGMTNNGVKISNENTTNGGSGEPMGGMSGSYSGLARFASTTDYIFAWVSRGAVDLTENTWMGSGYTHSLNRTNPRNVAIALFTDKYTKVGPEATSEMGVADGDSQVNWISTGSNDCSNAHAATFGTSDALVTWEEIENPICDYVAMGCRGQFSGSYFQQVDSTGAKVGAPFSDMDTYVAGDMVTMSNGSICWPYVSMTWDLSQPVPYAGSTFTTKNMSFACMNLDGSSGSSTTAVSSTAAGTAAPTVVAPVSSISSSATLVSPISSATSASVASTVPTTLVTSARSSSIAQAVSSSLVTTEAIIPISSAAASQSSTSDEDGDNCDDSGEDESSTANVATSSAASPVVSAAATVTDPSSSSEDGDGYDDAGEDESSTVNVATSSTTLPVVSATATASTVAPTLPTPSNTGKAGNDASAWAELYAWLAAWISRLEKMVETEASQH